MPASLVWPHPSATIETKREKWFGNYLLQPTRPFTVSLGVQKKLYCVLFFFRLTPEQKICGRGQYQRPLISNMSRIPIESKFKVLKGQARMSSYPSLVLFGLANERIQNSEASKPRICWPKRCHHHLTKQNQSLRHLT
jgi:hypothetical protein